MRIATKPFTLPTELVKQIKFISPNIYEFNSIAVHLNCPSLIENNETPVDDLVKNNEKLLQDIKETSLEILKLIDNVLLTLGPIGVLVIRKSFKEDLQIFDKLSRYIEISSNNYAVNHRFYKAKKPPNVVNSSGAGDNFNIGFITAMINGCSEDVCVSVGLECAITALKSSGAVPATYFDRNHHCWHEPAVFKNI